MVPSQSDRSTKKVLVCEKDNALSRELNKALRNEGYNVSIAHTTEEGLKMLYDFLPHLVVLNISCEGMTAYEFLKKKDAEPLLKKIPLILISRDASPISMMDIPANSVAEFIITYGTEPKEIVGRILTFFGHESNEAVKTETASPANKTILWVEDDKLITNILTKKFIASGFKLILAKNGEEASVKFKEMVPDIIILDLLLPGLSGFDLLAKIKQEKNLANVPTVVLTNLNKPSDIEKAKTFGVSKYLVKAGTSLDQIVEEMHKVAR
jgi:DNA-binding response OmpR family regulator